MNLKVDTISQRFGGLQALLDVSFAVEPGTIHGLTVPTAPAKPP